eukprot:TRINITY_DN1159_c0_g2_i1.p1 TRINITY_DN1159_c0_g2~~TRINITY_DN1159_c0_g2_i1.p1  ORF type:complete len:394 (-),score=77.73 TRINITY_DN1159_c0_g2_i1:9-1190(-)
MYREILSLRANCIGSGQCSPTDSRFFNFNRLFLKVPEHTWGIDTMEYLDWVNWPNADFQRVVNSPNYQIMIESWIEQRDYIYYAIKQLGNHPLASQINEAIAALKPPVPNIRGYTPLSDWGTTISAGNFDISFSSTGAISYLVDKTTRRQWSSSTYPIGQFTYDSLSNQDVDAFLKEYTICQSCGWWVPKDFGKFNLSGDFHASWLPQLTNAWSYEDNNVYSFVLFSQMDSRAWTTFGSPQSVWLTVNITKGQSIIDFDLQLIQKTPSRLPEALWFSFIPQVNDKNGWFIHKMNVPIPSLDVVQNGSMHLHNVIGGVNYKSTDGSLSIYSDDAPVVSVGFRIGYPTPFITPNPEQGMHFLLEDQLWGTNYVMWYPFLPEDENLRFRFRIEFNK